MRTTTIVLTLLSALFCLLVQANTAQAHRLNVFAYIAGNTIVVQAGFGRGHPAMGATVSILDDATQATLCTGKTAQDGTFTFPWDKLSVVAGITIRVDAGEGHVATWQIEELPTKKENKTSSTPHKPVPAQTSTRENVVPPSLRTELSTEELQSILQPILQPILQSSLQSSLQSTLQPILQEELTKALLPLYQEIAEEKMTRTPGLKEILGGLGWILGISGLLYGIRAKRKNSN